jgi:predicted AlkP superfamily pyrophosphatase or phosphodiesterase
MGCTCSLIRSAQPDVLLVHNCRLDTLRHSNGVFNEAVTAGLDQTDLWLGDVIHAMEDAGVYENTNFVILSDHGQMDLSRKVSLNALLVQEGFIDLAPDGQLYDWRAFAQSGGMSAAVYLDDPENKDLYQHVQAYLQKLVDEKVWGFTKVYTIPELQEKYGTYGPFSFMVATDGQTAVLENLTGPALTQIDLSDCRTGSATHGYEPELGPQPVFLGRGPAFKEGAVLAQARLIDEASTLARILGQEMSQAEGRCLEELLK